MLYSLFLVISNLVMFSLAEKYTLCIKSKTYNCSEKLD